MSWPKQLIYFLSQLSQIGSKKWGIDQQLASKLQEMEVARSKEQYQQRHDQSSRNNDDIQHYHKTSVELTNVRSTQAETEGIRIPGQNRQNLQEQ